MPRLGRAAIALGILALLMASGRASRAEDSWDALYAGGVKVGHQHVRVEPLKHEGRDLVRVQVNTVLSFRRGKDRVAMEVRYGTIETREGSVLRLDTRTKASQVEMKASGDVVDGKMVLTLDTGGQKQSETIVWGDDVRGPYAAELSLSREAMKPGEERTVKTFVPSLNRICLSKLSAKGMEEVALGPKGEKRNLLRVELVLTDMSGKPEPGTAQTLWVDSGGQILKGVVDMLGGMFVYRTTKAAAMAPDGDFDLIAAGIVKIKQTIPNPEKTRNIVYRVTLKDEEPSEVFPNDPRQTVTKGTTPRQATMQVHTVRPSDGTPSATAPGKEFLGSNPLITSEDREVIRLTQKAVGTKTDPWEKAVAIENWVFQNMRDKNFSTAFAPADEVARNLEGDCTEHGVLTAAMCRAAGVPARVVVGLVYADQLKGFGMHLWNEVFVNGRWVAIDSAFNQSEVDAVHIKLGDSSLDGVAPLEAFLPVIRVLGKMSLEPVEIR